MWILVKKKKVMASRILIEIENFRKNLRDPQENILKYQKIPKIPKNPKQFRKFQSISAFISEIFQDSKKSMLSGINFCTFYP